MVAADGDGVEHAGEVEVGGVFGGAGDFERAVDAWGFAADDSGGLFGRWHDGPVVRLCRNEDTIRRCHRRIYWVAAV